MNRLAIFLAPVILLTTACGPAPVESKVLPPSRVMDFDVLYGKNCAGCHGTDGKGGLAIGLRDSVYLAIVDDATLSSVTSNGVPGTSMPAFEQRSGGMLTGEQIKVIVGGIRTRWASPGYLRDANPPPYSADLHKYPADSTRGAAVYGTYCSSCHGADGRGGARASSIVNGAFLTMVSDQYLRTTIIAGRPELGAPDWRGNVPGKPMSAQEVSDVWAWLVVQRPRLTEPPIVFHEPLKKSKEGQVR